MGILLFSVEKLKNCDKEKEEVSKVYEMSMNSSLPFLFGDTDVPSSFTQPSMDWSTVPSFTFPDRVEKGLLSDRRKRVVVKKKSIDLEPLYVENYQSICMGLKTIPDIFLMDNLRTLDLSDNELHEINIPHNSKITHLTLKNNRIDKIRCLPKGLLFLDVSVNQLKDTSWLILFDCYPHLNKMIMNYNQMTCIQGTWPPQLVHLECDHNDLRRVDLIAPRLRVLRIASNRMDTFQMRCPLLRVLDVAHNEQLDRLPMLPYGIKQLSISRTGIQQLVDNPETEYIEPRPIDTLPDSLELLEMDEIHVDFISKLPTQLQVLECKDCALQNLEVVGSLRHLRQLGCSFNALTRLSVPASLETLNCSNNELVQLDLPYGSKLTYVKCSDNHLKYFPHIPEGIREIRNFVCHKNPFFFQKHNGWLRVPLSVNFLRNLSYVRNKAHVVKEVVQHPDKYRHLVRHWGAVHERFATHMRHWLQQAETNDCPVCYENIQQNTLCLSECSHIFCAQCALKLNETATMCPMCRQVLSWRFRSFVHKEKLVMECASVEEAKGIQFHFHRAFETV